VTAVGPTTLAALLSSLLVGFKTLAIERRSQDVWETLRKVKLEFTKFGKPLDDARKSILKLSETLEDMVGTRTRAINRSLRTVEELIEADNMPQLETLSVDESEEPVAKPEKLTMDN
jgi:DNA recombination protein RmuC